MNTFKNLVGGLFSVLLQNKKYGLEFDSSFKLERKNVGLATKQRSGLKQILVLIALLVSSGSALAVSLTATGINNDSRVSIQWSDPTHYSGYVILNERAGTSGTWTEIFGYNQADAYTYTTDPRSPGTWQYYIRYCYFAGPYPSCANSAYKTVTLTPQDFTPVVTVVFNPSTINEGQSSTFSWSSTNSTSCSASGISGVSATSGSVNYQASSNPGSSYDHPVTVTCSGSGGSGSKTANVHVNYINDAPTISNIGNQTIDEGDSSDPLNFTIGDQETSASSLSLTASSSNQNLINNSDILLEGSGSLRTITLQARPNGSGNSVISINVSDGNSTTTETFTVYVNDIPAELSVSEYTSTDGSYTVSWSKGKEVVVVTENGANIHSGAMGGPYGQSARTKTSDGTYVYRIQDCNYNGVSVFNCTETDTATVVVDLPSPTVNASFNTSTISEGGSATLTWSSSNASSCSATGISGVNATSGSVNYNASTAMSADQSVHVTVTCSGGGGAASDSASLQVNWVNDSPTISNITNKTINEDTNTGNIAFTVSDEESSDASLSITRTSSNTTLVPPANIVLDGSGSNRTVKVTPVANEYGTATITLNVSDGSNSTADESFVLTVASVNDEPTISPVPAIETSENTGSSTVSFTVDDIDSGNDSLLVQAISSTNSSLIPTGNVHFGGSGSNREVWVTPVAGQSGSADITVRVSDGSLSASSTLVVNVTGIEAPGIPVFSGDPLATVADPTNETLDGEVYYGGVKGAYSVGNDGSFNYNVPFVVPVGIQGMAPGVGVSYNSNAKNSVVGWGFNLTGFSYIGRCEANYKRDGRSSGINDGDDYRYCLDGSRLVHIGGNEFRTESESFLHITNHGDFWSVKNKAGTVARYGYDANSKELSAGSTHTWKLDRQEDTFGNYLTIEYEAGQTNGAIYGRPAKISYTLNDSLPNMPTREVLFAYSPRSDIISGYLAGRAYIEDKRLSSVTVKNNGVDLWTYHLAYEDENPDKVVDDSAMKSTLDSIQRCFNNAGCEEALTMDWSQRREADYVYVPIGNNFDARRYFLGDVDHYFDIDGDGKEDGYKGYDDTETLSFYDANYNSSTGSYEADTSTTREITPKSEFHDIDINGDGYKDIVRFNPTISGVQVYLNEADNVGGRKIPAIANSGYTVGSNNLKFNGIRSYEILKNLYTEFSSSVRSASASDFGYNIQFVDFNRDGLIDLVRTPPVCPQATICLFEPGQYAKDISVLLNTGSGWKTVNSEPDFVTLYDQWDNDKQFRSIQFVDINGDSYIDIFGAGTSPDGSAADPVFLIGNGASEVTQYTFTDVSASTNWQELEGHVGDFDGDGLIDFVHIPNQKPGLAYNQTISIRRGQGGSFANATNASEDNYLSGCSNERSPLAYCSNLVVDFNNDGLDDVVQMSGCPRLEDVGYDSDAERQAIENELNECFLAISSNHKEQVWLSRGLDTDGSIVFADPIIYKALVSSISPATRVRYSQFTDYNLDGIIENSPNRIPGFKEMRIEKIYSEARDITVNYRSFDMTSVFMNGGEMPGDDHLKDFHEQQDDFVDTIPEKRSAMRFGVDSLEISDGIGGVSTIGYYYEGAKFDISSYGHLGFEKIESVEQITGELGYIRTESHYHQIGNEQYQLGRKLKRRNTYASEDGSTEVLLSDKRYKWKVKLFDDDDDFNVDGHQSPHFLAYIYEESTNKFDLNGSEIGSSVTRNYASSEYTCDQITIGETEIIDTYLAGSSEDTDYGIEGVLLNGITITCDANGSAANTPDPMTQIIAMQNDNLLNQGERRGLVETVRSTSWFGRSDDLPVGDLWPLAQNGVADDASCSELEGQFSPWASTTVYTFDNDGLMETKTVNPGAGAGKTTTTSVEYNISGSLKTITDSWTNISGDASLGFSSSTITTDESFNASGQREITTTIPLGQSTVVYDSVFDTPLTQTDVNNLVVTSIYDPLGRIISTVASDGNVVQFDYRTCDNCFSESSSALAYTQIKVTGQSATRNYFDRLGRSVGTRTRGFDGGFVYSGTVYNNRGLTEEVFTPYYAGDTQQITHTDYDLLNRPIKVTLPDMNSTGYVYDGLKQQIFNVKNQVQTVFNSVGGIVLRSTDNAGTPVDFTHWPNGSLKTTEVGGGSNPETKVCVGFDDMGRQNFLDDPNTGRVTYKYNALGLLSEQTDAKGQVTRYKYDDLGRTLSRYDDADGDNLVQTWSYDNQLLGLVDSLNGTNTDGSDYQESYSYDAFGRVTNNSASYQGKSFSSSVSYDNHGRALSTTYPGGYRIANVYNSWGVLSKIVETSDKQILWEADEVNALGQVKKSTLGDSSVVDREYTPETGLLESITATRDGSTSMHHFYSFDPLGNLETRTDYIASLTEAFCYDSLNRLQASRIGNCSESDVDYSYDSLGNIETKKGISGTYGYGNNAGPHAVTSANGLDYLYDNNGNLTRSLNSSNQAVREITYSAFDKPTSIVKGGWSSYVVYSANHNRIKRTDFEGVNVKRTTYYFGAYEETIEAQGETRRIYYIGDYAQRVEVEDTGESYHEFLHTDHIGSIVTKSSDRDYNLNTGSFSPWGKRLEDDWDSDPTGPEYTNTAMRGFTNHEHLDPVGLIHMNGRVYDPEVGRFLSPDPLVQAPFNTQSYNRYSYVWNNPLSLTDPTGYYGRGGRSAVDMHIAQKSLESPLNEFSLSSSVSLGASGFMIQLLKDVAPEHAKVEKYDDRKASLGEIFSEFSTASGAFVPWIPVGQTTDEDIVTGGLKGTSFEQVSNQRNIHLVNSAKRGSDVPKRHITTKPEGEVGRMVRVSMLQYQHLLVKKLKNYMQNEVNLNFSGSTPILAPLGVRYQYVYYPFNPGSEKNHHFLGGGFVGMRPSVRVSAEFTIQSHGSLEPGNLIMRTGGTVPVPTLPVISGGVTNSFSRNGSRTNLNVGVGSGITPSWFMVWGTTFNSSE